MKKALSVVFVFALALSFSTVAFAQAPPSFVPTTLTSSTVGTSGTITSTATLVSTILGLVSWIAWFVGLLAVVMGLWAGILFITAAGDSAKLTTARNIVLYAVIGIAVAILAFGLVSVSKSLFGL